MDLICNYGVSRMNKHIEFPDNATPLSDYSGLILSWVYNLADLNRVEAENIMIAQRKYLKNLKKASETWHGPEQLKIIHKNMFEDVWTWAGHYRTSVTSIGVSPGLIPVRMAELCFEVNAWFLYPVQLTFIEMAARIHHKLVFIHPFENGNGRFSRLVADQFLLQWGCAHPIWPSYLSQDGSIRKDYVQMLKSADRGDYSPLERFMQKYGATDPKISDLLSNKFYQSFIKQERGFALVRALLRYKKSLLNDPSDALELYVLAVKANLIEIAQLLQASSTKGVQL